MTTYLSIEFDWFEYDAVVLPFITSPVIWDSQLCAWPETRLGIVMSRYSDASKNAADAKRDVRQIASRGQQVPKKFLDARDVEATKADLKVMAENEQKNNKK